MYEQLARLGCRTASDLKKAVLASELPGELGTNRILSGSSLGHNPFPLIMLFLAHTGQPSIPFRRRATVRLSSFWPPGLTVPPALQALQSADQWVSLIHLFAHIADRTAPPFGYGFSLGETWAFCRYFGAVATVPAFSLSPLWEDLDFHQKTILSDDWGVGIASLIATRAFQPIAIANTSEWLRHCGGIASARRQPGKRGPSKSPDFVFEDANGRINLVEAKGTQGKQSALTSQMDIGYDQKNAIDFHVPGAEGIRLVVGTRIPLAGNGAMQIVVNDPPMDVERILAGQVHQDVHHESLAAPKHSTVSGRAFSHSAHILIASLRFKERVAEKKTLA